LQADICREALKPLSITRLASIAQDEGDEHSAMEYDTPGGSSQGGFLGPSNASLLPAGDFQPSLDAGHTKVQMQALLEAQGIFKNLEVPFKTIPVLLNYIGAVAVVGSTLAEIALMLNKTSESLEMSTCRLAAHLRALKEQSSPPQREKMLAGITNIVSELQSIRGKIEALMASGVLEKYRRIVCKLSEEMELIVSLDAARLITEFENVQMQEERRGFLDRLGDGNYGARGSSLEDVTCLPNTRVGILGRIDDWIRSKSTLDRVLWIRGMAGRGKSTIASTVAHSWMYRASCAIYHFRRDENAVGNRFVCTLARQLGKSLVTEVRDAILKSVRENEDIGKERLDEQFTTLLVGSLRDLRDFTHPILIVVDALDECESVFDAVRFVKLIDRHSSSLPPNMKFLLTCRPEAPLLVALEPRRWHMEDLDSSSDVVNDITHFIQYSCAQIRNDHDLPENWPSPGDVTRVAEMSQGLFQWARSAITYVRERSPTHRLQELLGRPSAWTGLDGLYHQVLSEPFSEKVDPLRRQILSWVLGTLVVTPYPISLAIMESLCAGHEVFKDQQDIIGCLQKDILADLSSLLFIPYSPDEPMRLMHTSIHDFLINRQRCGRQQQYFVDPVQHHLRLAGISLGIMNRELKPKICKLPGHTSPNIVVQDFFQNHVSKGLEYCCRSWSVHLTKGAPQWETEPEDISDILLVFTLVSEQKLLSWLEVMSLVGATAEAYVAAMRVYQWLLKCPWKTSDDSLETLWNDTQRFITVFMQPISFGVRHIYASALPYCPTKTKLWEQYGSQAIGQILDGERQITWNANIWTSPVGSKVNDVAFSPDGAVLASGSDDGTIRFWDARTGALLAEPPTTCRGWIISVVFSPDGKFLAAGCSDGTISVWDAHTAALLREHMTGRNGGILSVAFSPNSEKLASGSDDGAIQLWDTHGRAPLGKPLTGHVDGIISVAFSPDGELLASGSYDTTIHLWNAQTGASLGRPMAGHQGGIRSVTFSLDSKVLVSGSNDGTVCVWEAQTGALLARSLISQGDWIASVAFSPDGKLLAFGSGDGTIRLWDAQTGTALGGPLISHSHWITFVAFSPDGKALVSGSDDQSIHLWDAQIQPLSAEPPPGHGDWITSVAVSQDNDHIAVGYNGGTITLWDPLTGVPFTKRPTLHQGGIRCLAFSRNGQVLASGSTDRTIRVWDVETWSLLYWPLAGHRDWITCIAFSPDGRILASGSDGGSICFWDVRIKRGKLLDNPATCHLGGITSITFSPDGKVVASASDDGMICLWTAATSSSGIATGHFTLYHKMGGHEFVSSQWSEGIINHSDPKRIWLQLGWLVLGGRRLLWVPPQYWGESFTVIRSPKKLALFSEKILFLLDVSHVQDTPSL
ncbi:hypothetical protein FRC01_001950, partial [Tulasnella sp. 417]